MVQAACVLLAALSVLMFLATHTAYVQWQHMQLIAEVGTLSLPFSCVWV